MASGSYARKPVSRESETKTKIPARATRQLPAVQTGDPELVVEPALSLVAEKFEKIKKITSALQSIPRMTLGNRIEPPVRVVRGNRIVDSKAPDPLERHKPWLKPLIICMLLAVVSSFVLISAGMFQRPGDPQLFTAFDAKVYDVQVGGSMAQTVFSQTVAPLPNKIASAPKHGGPYSVLGQPTITADFINQVLAAYGSPAAGKGQALYDLGLKYGIDPVFALAFFQHESTFGKFGEARQSLSLGNLRCIPDAQCTDNYAWFPSWEAGFEAYYKLIRNLYIAYWGLTTVPQIIPRYAPTADNNNEAAYIASVEHSIDVWHSGQIFT